LGKVNGKVAFITGAARGQGRSHAVTFAEQGADIIAIDLCEQVATVAYPMSTIEDLTETQRLVEKAGERISAQKADVRDPDQLAQLGLKQRAAGSQDKQQGERVKVHGGGTHN
jgi:NAD(P)-dependent dehydrogenase (short-subunit alcohol dehydrogenase family)